MKISVFLGAPGSGKGTQAKRLAESHGFTHFSTGDMLRAAMAAKTAVGLKAKAYVDKGELVADGVMIDMIKDALSGMHANANIILDGFPRTGPQAIALDDSANTKVNRAIYFAVPREALIKRLTGRRICTKCGEPYHLDFMRPKKNGHCDKCGHELMQRQDDSKDVVVRRLDIFNSQNDALLAYYKKHAKLKEINADRPIDDVQRDLIEMLS